MSFLLPEPIGPRSFLDLAHRPVGFTVTFNGEAYNVPMASIPVFDHNKVMVIPCAEGSPCDVLVLPTSVDFKNMAPLVIKKTLRMFVPCLTPSKFQVILAPL
jgi:hypothetical protein